MSATGTFIAVLKGSTLTWSLNFSHLSGSATVADVNEAKPGASGPVVIVLCSECKSPVTGRSLLGKTVITALEEGGAYIVIHTKKNPQGEIRGQLKSSR